MIIHTLKDCRTARAILTHGGLDGRLLDKEYLHCIDWLEDEDEARIIWERARTLNHDFKIHNIVNKPIIPMTPTVQKRKKSRNGFMKINVNDTVLNNKAGFGVIIHDCDDTVVVALRSKSVNKTLQLSVTEQKRFIKQWSCAQKWKLSGSTGAAIK
ncbi:hypothetical protein Gotur_002303 [Gossypium turneri]